MIMIFLFLLLVSPTVRSAFQLGADKAWQAGPQDSQFAKVRDETRYVEREQKTLSLLDLVLA